MPLDALKTSPPSLMLSASSLNLRRFLYLNVYMVSCRCRTVPQEPILPNTDSSSVLTPPEPLRTIS